MIQSILIAHASTADTAGHSNSGVCSLSNVILLHPADSAILVPAKSGRVPGSIAIGVLRLVTVFIAIFSAVAVIAVVILSARIGVERLIFVHVVASLAHSVQISSTVAHIAAIPAA